MRGDREAFFTGHSCTGGMADEAPLPTGSAAEAAAGSGEDGDGSGGAEQGAAASRETPDTGSLASLFLSLASCDAPTKAWAIPGGKRGMRRGGFQSVHAVRNVPKNGMRRWVRTWDEDGVPSGGFPVQLGDDVVALSPSPSRTKLAVLRKGEAGEGKGGGGAAWAPHALEVWGPGGLAVSVPCASHGAVFADEYFGGRGVPCWSPDENVVAYVAERKPPETPVGFWDEAKIAADPSSVAPGAEWAHKDDLGERYQGLRAPRVFGVNVAERRAFCMTPEGSLKGTGVVACGQPTFDPTGNSLVFTGWLGGEGVDKEAMGPYPAHRTLGVIFCNNRPSSLFDLRVPLAHELRALGPGKDVDDVGVARRMLPVAVTNARSAAFSPCGLHLAYLSAHNIAKGTHESTAVLSVVSRENTGRPLAFGEPKVVCGAVDAPSSHPHGFPGLFSILLPSVPWVDVGGEGGGEGLARYRILANSTWRSANRVVVINPAAPEGANDVYPLEFKGKAQPASTSPDEGGTAEEERAKEEVGTEVDAKVSEEAEGAEVAETKEGEEAKDVEVAAKDAVGEGPDSDATPLPPVEPETEENEPPSTEEKGPVAVEGGEASPSVPPTDLKESPCSWSLLDCYVEGDGRATMVAVRHGFDCPPELYYASAGSMGVLAAGDTATEALRWTRFASADAEGPLPGSAEARDAIERMSVEVLQVSPSVPAEGLTPEDDTFEAIRVRCGAAGGPKGVVVIPHGGPHSAVTHMWLPSAAFFCALGYDLLLLNFRGSTGFGQAQLESLPGKVGQQDVDDCISCLDAAGLTAGSGDSSMLPLIVNGGSHGGFLSAHLIGQFPGLFCAAIMRNPVTDLPSMLAVTDIPDWCHVEALGSMTDADGTASRYADLYADPETLAVMHRASPSAHVSNVKAPVLMLIGGKDRRVPPSQGLAYANELRRRGVTVKTNFYPEDGHALDRPQTELDCWVHAALFIAPVLRPPEPGSSKKRGEASTPDAAPGAEAAPEAEAVPEADAEAPE